MKTIRWIAYAVIAAECWLLGLQFVFGAVAGVALAIVYIYTDDAP